MNLNESIIHNQLTNEMIETSTRLDLNSTDLILTINYQIMDRNIDNTFELSTAIYRDTSAGCLHCLLQWPDHAQTGAFKKKKLLSQKLLLSASALLQNSL